MQVKKQQLELDMKQQIGSKYGKEYTKAVYCYPTYLIYILHNVLFIKEKFSVQNALIF